MLMIKMGLKYVRLRQPSLVDWLEDKILRIRKTTIKEGVAKKTDFKNYWRTNSFIDIVFEERGEKFIIYFFGLEMLTSFQSNYTGMSTIDCRLERLLLNQIRHFSENQLCLPK